ncbi:hypothetical protein ACVW1E_001457 [Ewingella americana]
MSTFTQVWETLDWDDLSLRINSKTAGDVERALGKAKISRDDFMALISPRRAALSRADGAKGAGADPSTLRQHGEFLRPALLI